MKLAEFKRRLMTDPGDRSPDMREARARGGEFAEAAADSDHFEHALKRAVNVPAPPGLADRIILRQSLEGQRRTMRWVQWGAVAAALVIAVSVAVVLLNPATSTADLQRHIAWHWKLDGPQVLAASLEGRDDPAHVQEVLAELGVQLSPELLDAVRLTKFCPTPDGKGAHMVFDGPAGPVTVYYMPNTHLAESPVRLEIDGGMQSLAFNVDRGSLAVLAEAGTDTAALAERIREALRIAPGTTI
jgi:hypothetical protein